MPFNFCLLTEIVLKTGGRNEFICAERIVSLSGWNIHIVIAACIGGGLYFDLKAK
jgi:hypothetical protein